jgi:hypothetical protein
MNTVKCGIGECPSVFQTEEPLSPNARYVCKLHKPTEQKVSFQENQFDKDLKRGAKPVGTTHIANQASEVIDADTSRLLLGKGEHVE